MNVLEVREKREQCEEKISQILEEFCNKTELTVQSVEVQTMAQVPSSDQVFLVDIIAII